MAFAFAVLLYGKWLHAPDLPRTLAVFALFGALVHGVHAAQQAVWMRYPWRPVLTGLFDGVVGFVLLGLVLHLLR